MNFNSFIKIKIIKWKDNSKSTYINGVVMSKDLADKRMRNEIEKPRILLLKDSLNFPQ
jgi:chaperonin GroEL (HSP60 family)